MNFCKQSFLVIVHFVGKVLDLNCCPIPLWKINVHIIVSMNGDHFLIIGNMDVVVIEAKRERKTTSDESQFFVY